MTRLRTTAPFCEQLWQHIGTGIELLDTMVPHVNDVHRAVVLVQGHDARAIELAVAIAKAAPRHNEFACHVELLDAEVCAVDDIDKPADPVDGDAPGGVELPLSVASPPELQEIAAELPVKLLNAMVVGIHH